MRNLSKILCVVMALIIAFSAASCSFTKQYAYQKDDIKLPIGVYIYYLYQAYQQAQGFAQNSDLYDSETGRYDGKKSFLQMEITDNDDNTAVAEQWIKDKAKENVDHAIAIWYEFNQLGATMTEVSPEDKFTDLPQEAQSVIATAYSNAYYSGGLNTDVVVSDESTVAEIASAFDLEQYGIGTESWIFCYYTVSQMEDIVFEKEYAADGPNPVSDEELTKFFTENYISYKYFSANLYTTETDTEGNSTSTAMSEDEVKDYQSEFKGYAKDLSGGDDINDVIGEYNEEHETEITPTETVEMIDKETEDEIKLAAYDLKEGKATSKIIGENEDSRQIYVIYREPIKKQVENYITNEENRPSVLGKMKQDDFRDLLDSIVEEINPALDGACNGYAPSMFEKKS